MEAVHKMLSAKLAVGLGVLRISGPVRGPQSESYKGGEMLRRLITSAVAKPISFGAKLYPAHFRLQWAN